MRAVVDDPSLVGLIGERPTTVRRAAWAIGSSFAALSGILLAPTLGLDATLLTLLVVQAFGACAIGLFSNLPGTFAGGLIVGVASSVATKYFTTSPFSGIPASTPFLILMGVLLIVPAARLPASRQKLRGLARQAPPMSRRARTATVAGVGLMLLAVPSVVGTHLSVWIAGLIYFIVFGSLALLVWTSGQISLCHAAFVAVGATTMAHLRDAGVPWAIALVAAGLLTVPLGALIAIPAIRVSGIYLALVTLGFGILMQNVVYPSFLMFGAEQSVSTLRPVLGPFDAHDDTTFYFVVLAVAALCFVGLAAIQRGRLGRLLRAMSETSTMLETNGLGVRTTRVLVLCISAYFAGVAGALVVTQFGSVSGVGYGPITSLLYLAVIAIGGTQLIRSAAVAALLLGVAPGYITDFDVDRQTLIFGVVAIAAALLLASRAAIQTWMQRAANESATRFETGPSRNRSGQLDMVLDRSSAGT